MEINGFTFNNIIRVIKNLDNNKRISLFENNKYNFTEKDFNIILFIFKRNDTICHHNVIYNSCNYSLCKKIHLISNDFLEKCKFKIIY